MHTENQHIEALLSCLVILTKINNRPFTAEALTAGLPLERSKSWPEMFSLTKGKSNFTRAAYRAGFKSKLVKRELQNISPLVLPAILILKNNNACILEKIELHNNRAKIISVEVGESEHWVNLNDLEEEYLGYSYFLKPIYNYESRSLQLSNIQQQHWFWDTVKKSKGIYINVIIASIMINLFILATPLFTMNVYDRVVPNGAFDTLWVLAIGVSVIYIFDIGLKFLRTYFLEVSSKKSDIIMSSIIYEQVLNLKMSVFPKSVGSFASNLKDFDTIKNFLNSSTVSILIDLPFAIMFLIVINLIAGSLVLIPMAIIVLIVLYSFLLKAPLKKSIESTYAAAANKNAILIESLSNIETIKYLGASGHSQWELEEATGDIANKSIKTKLLSDSIKTVTQFLIQINTIIIVIYGVYKIESLELSLGGLIASIILSSRAISPMGQIASLVANYQQTKTAYDAIDNIMHLPVERKDGKKFIQNADLQGNVEFENVSFKYGDDEQNVLKNISFKIKAGEKVAFIGKVGSGKTTIEKLAAGLYSATEGSVKIDGIDINQINPANLRSNLAYVSQEITLFRGTVKENIIYKAPYVDDELIQKAAKASLVYDFISKHPQGYDMPIQERGAGLSGGQKQKIAIARAILLDSPIVIMDEPTNALDNQTESKLVKNLKDYTKDKTLLLVTHKQSLLSLVDRIIVVDNGKIILDGKKEDVLRKLQQGASHAS